MNHTQIPPCYRPLRHLRLFELIRQQSQAQSVARNIASDAAQNDAVIAEFSRRAAASWRRSR